MTGQIQKVTANVEVWDGKDNTYTSLYFQVKQDGVHKKVEVSVDADHPFFQGSYQLHGISKSDNEDSMLDGATCRARKISRRL